MNENIPLNDETAGAAATYDYSKMNFIQRVFGVIGSPEKTMQSLEQKPRILFALLLSILTPVVIIISVLPMFKEYTRGALETTYENMNIEATAEQIDQALNITTITGLAGGGVFAVALWLFGALILWGIIKILKGEGSYKQILSVTGYAAVISVLGAIITIITTRLTGVYSEVSITSLATILPDMKGNFIYGVAKSLEVFSIWKYIVIAIGVATVSKLDKKKAYIIVACFFVALLIFAGLSEVSMAKAI